MVRQKLFVVLLAIAICVMSGPAIATTQCNTYINVLYLLNSDVQPHVARTVGSDVRVIGVYQPVNNNREAIIFTDKGKIRIYHLNNDRWYDPQRGQFLCR